MSEKLIFNVLPGRGFSFVITSSNRLLLFTDSNIIILRNKILKLKKNIIFFEKIIIIFWVQQSYYISNSANGDDKSINLNILRIVRLFRIFRVIKLSKNNESLCQMIKTMGDSTREVGCRSDVAVYRGFSRAQIMNWAIFRSRFWWFFSPFRAYFMALLFIRYASVILTKEVEK